MMYYDIELTSILNISVEILTDIFMKEMCYLNLIINRYMTTHGLIYQMVEEKRNDLISIRNVFDSVN